MARSGSGGATLTTKSVEGGIVTVEEKRVQTGTVAGTVGAGGGGTSSYSYSYSTDGTAPMTISVSRAESKNVNKRISASRRSVG